MFDSSTILLYLGDKTGKFMVAPKDRPELLSWLFFIASGLGPFSGQAVHFQFVAPEGPDYARNRYRREAERHYKVLDDHLADRDFIVGDSYTIADMSAWGWIDRASRVLKGEADLLAGFPNIRRWFKAIDARPVVARARAVGKDHPFKKEVDEETRARSSRRTTRRLPDPSASRDGGSPNLDGQPADAFSKSTPGQGSSKGMSTTLYARLGAIFFIIWSVFHVYVAWQIYSLALAQTGIAQGRMLHRGLYAHDRAVRDRGCAVVQLAERPARLLAQSRRRQLGRHRLGPGGRASRLRAAGARAHSAGVLAGGCALLHPCPARSVIL